MSPPTSATLWTCSVFVSGEEMQLHCKTLIVEELCIVLSMPLSASSALSREDHLNPSDAADICYALDVQCFLFQEEMQLHCRTQIVKFIKQCCVRMFSHLQHPGGRMQSLLALILSAQHFQSYVKIKAVQPCPCHPYLSRETVETSASSSKRYITDRSCRKAP